MPYHSAMQQLSSFVSLARLGVLLALLGPGAVAMSAGCGDGGEGGCPWNNFGEVVLTPATPCLDIHATDHGQGSCTDPGLVVANHCDQLLVIPSRSAHSPEIHVPPGQTSVVDIPLEHANHVGDVYHFQVELYLNDQRVLASFDTWR